MIFPCQVCKKELTSIYQVKQTVCSLDCKLDLAIKTKGVPSGDCIILKQSGMHWENNDVNYCINTLLKTKYFNIPYHDKRRVVTKCRKQGCIVKDHLAVLEYRPTGALNPLLNKKKGNNSALTEVFENLATKEDVKVLKSMIDHQNQLLEYLYNQLQKQTTEEPEAKKSFNNSWLFKG